MSGASGVIEWRVRLDLDDTMPDGWTLTTWERTLRRAGDYYIGSLKSDNPVVVSRDSAMNFINAEDGLGCWHQLTEQLAEWYAQTHAATLDSAYAPVRITTFMVQLVGIWGEDIGTADLLRGESVWFGADDYRRS